MATGSEIECSNLVLGNVQDFITNYKDIDKDLEEVLLPIEGQKMLLYCQLCPKTYKTKSGYQRHLLAKHNSQLSEHSIEEISDEKISIALRNSISELKSDMCYPKDVRKQWESYNLVRNHPLYSQIRCIYTGL